MFSRAVATRELSKVLKDQVLRIDESIAAGRYMLFSTSRRPLLVLLFSVVSEFVHLRGTRPRRVAFC